MASEVAWAPHSASAARSSATYWIYGAIGFPLATMGYPLGIFLPDLYATEVGMPLTVVGLILGLSRLTDALTDPLLGFASDRTPTRFGRRKPWIALGVPIMLFGLWMLFHPAEDASRWYLIWWISLMTIGMTLILIPYSAWGAELSTEYHARTRIEQSREVFILIGLMAAAVVPFVIQEVMGLGNSSGHVLHGLAWVLVFTMPLTAGFVLWRVPEAPYTPPRKLMPLGTSVRMMLRNGLFRQVITIELIITLGEAFRNALSLFFIRDYIGIPNVGRFYLVYFGVGLLAMPVWTHLAKRFGKHRSLSAAMALVCFVSMGLFALDRGQTGLFYLLFALKGFCFGAFAYLPRAMLADVIDIDFARTRESRAGSYFSVHGIMTKLAQAMGPGLALPVLASAGYSTTLAAGATNSEAAILWLGALYAVVPTILFLLALYIAWGYPLTQERHRRIEERLNRRRQRALVG